MYHGTFETPMELHCSQTKLVRLMHRASLRPLWNYTALKLVKVTWYLFVGLRPLWNYTALKQAVEELAEGYGLRPLWNYTALKHSWERPDLEDCLRPLWNYTALKPKTNHVKQAYVWDPYGITLLSNTPYCVADQTTVWDPYGITLLSNATFWLGTHFQFETPMELHCSQTIMWL